MRKWTLGKLAIFLGGEVSGNPEKLLKGTCALEEPHPEKLAFIESSRQVEILSEIMLGAVILPPAVGHSFPDAVLHKNPKLAFAWAGIAFNAPDLVVLPPVADLDDPSPLPFTGGEWRIPAGIHPKASVSHSAKVHTDAEVGAFAHIEERAEVGDGTVIYPLVWVGRDVKIGERCRIFPNVSIYPGTEIGNDVIIHSGTVIGSDGFGFVTHKGGHTKFPQTGRVVIDDEVEIGANCSIDRASLRETVIGRGAKLDNGIQIAHGARVGEYSLIAAQAGLSGGTRIGSWCTIGGQAGFQAHITVGDRSIIGARSGVIGNLCAESKVSGYPARPHKQAMRTLAVLHKLPEHFTELEQIKRRIKALEEKLEDLK